MRCIDPRRSCFWRNQGLLSSRTPFLAADGGLKRHIENRPILRVSSLLEAPTTQSKPPAAILDPFDQSPEPQLRSHTLPETPVFDVTRAALHVGLNGLKGADPEEWKKWKLDRRSWFAWQHPTGALREPDVRRNTSPADPVNVKTLNASKHHSCRVCVAQGMLRAATSQIHKIPGADVVLGCPVPRGERLSNGMWRGIQTDLVTFCRIPVNS